MKQFLLFFMALLLISSKTNASHMMGGEMVAVYDNASGKTYVKISLYRDILGISVPPDVPLVIWKYDNPTSQYVSTGTVTVNYNSALSTLLLPSFPYGVEVAVYTDSLSLTPGSYKFTMMHCCRNIAIMNAANPGGANLLLATEFYIPPSGGNSTPDFLSIPVAYFPLGQSANYNPLPYDADGDSISWALNTPISVWNNVNTANTPVAGHLPPPADPSGPFAMNAITGEITWKPNTLGNFIQSFEVKEYRGGVQIGSIIRDMQYVIIVDSNASANNFTMITPYNYNQSGQYNYVYYEPGQPFVFEIKGANTNPAAVVTMTANGTLFLGANPPTFTTIANGNEVTGKFEWTPPANVDKDYVVAFRISDETFTKDATLVFRKNPGPQAIGTHTGLVDAVSVYPNPATSQVNVALTVNKNIPKSEIVLYNITGQEVATLYRGAIPAGQFKCSQHIDLPPGSYQLVVRSDETIIKTTQVQVK